MLRKSLCISYPSHNYLTRNSNETLLPFLRDETIRMNFKYNFVKVWLEVPEYIKCNYDPTCNSEMPYWMFTLTKLCL